jgi:protein-L-isoaspartate(D-aspartate) O-methyltransferase
VTHAVRLALPLTLSFGQLSEACARNDAAPAHTATGPIEHPQTPAAPRPGGSASARSSEAPLPDALARALTERKGERSALVRELEQNGIRDRRVLAALERVPRHRFVPEAQRASAYDDRPLPIGSGQTISQPHVVAMMTAAVAPKPSDRCLEIGTGSGYQAAVLSELCARVYSIEYLASVFEFGKRNLGALGYRVELRHGDGYAGWPEAAPFDVIVVTAAPERVPEPLLAQLREQGRLVIPIGPEGAVQELELWKRVAPGSTESAFERRVLSQVRFVPFLGDGGR